uniref:hypothetical protein n=1 Tax=Amycolatopsis sp. CA-096443 TaxID=3239919 RepID=UPI003F49713C
MPTDPKTRRRLRERADDIIEAYSASSGDADDAHLLADLAAVAAELARHGRDTPLVVADLSADLTAEDPRDAADDARTAALLAALADARATGAAWNPGLAGWLQPSSYVAAVLAQMAGRAEQPGWLLAHRLNVLIDHAFERDLHTGLAQRLALAASRRPDGENPADRAPEAEPAALRTA